MPVVQETRWVELFKYPRLVAAGCLTGLTQTGGASLGLWGPTLLVLVLVPKITPEHAAFLMIFVNMAGIAGRFSITALIEPMGRRGSGTLYCVLAAVLMVLAGYLHDVYVAGASLFYILIVAQAFSAAPSTPSSGRTWRRSGRPGCAPAAWASATASAIAASSSARSGWR